jgi:hypothetical protein
MRTDALKQEIAANKRKTAEMDFELSQKKFLPVPPPDFYDMAEIKETVE